MGNDKKDLLYYSSMIQNCYLLHPTLLETLTLKTSKAKKTDQISIIKKNDNPLPYIEFYIEFEHDIIAWRNHDYTWCDLTKERISNEYSSKILVLANGTYVSSASNTGLWIFEGDKSNRIKWILKHPDLTPVFTYSKNDERIFVNSFAPENYNLKLLYSENSVPEISRSKIPFTPIICFTDHCDFDTKQSLDKQLAFFNKNNIRVTKGFFINFFSKRPENASYSKCPDEIKTFNSSGHELAYHSLTQSIRKLAEGIDEFKKFSPPIKNITTWIDHGHQPYNLTYINRRELNEVDWAELMNSKNITNLWSYLDSGTASKGIINQLNPEHFTTKRAILSQKGIINKSRFYFRTYLFYSGNEALIIRYRKIANLIKSLIQKKNISSAIKLVPNIFNIILPLLKNIFLKSKRETPFRYARFAPVTFKHKIGEHWFNMFQTVEVTDFEATFSKENLSLLIKEKGMLITHNYFSSPLDHQKGKLFDDENISLSNEENFMHLGKLIKNKDIWNPTVNELISHFNKILDTTFEYDSDTNQILAKNKAADVTIRYISYE